MSFFTGFFYKLSLLGQLWQNKPIIKIFRWNALIILFQLIFLVGKFNHLPQQVPLFYSRPWGEARLASSTTLFFLPGFSIIILLINHLLAAIFLQSISLFTYLSVVFSLLFSSFSLISIVKIIYLIS